MEEMLNMQGNYCAPSHSRTYSVPSTGAL